MALPTDRPPTHPGEMLLEEHLRPGGRSPADLAAAIGETAESLDALVKRQRTLTARDALLLARELGTTPDVWLGLQTAWDLWHAERDLQQLDRLRDVGLDVLADDLATRPLEEWDGRLGLVHYALTRLVSVDDPGARVRDLISAVGPLRAYLAERS